ncbi:uncharacterized protein LOC132791463 [Drosophila nasuta]|uniref:uncharacterized protein LOC132791463 n=1 Tax=Drosophila nasuta TaxID=42062 RepID=UPI00295F1688|nr:uncharacterized protein LOC132791463 [Drosophila nasuta]
MWTNNYWTFTYRNTLASISNDFKSTDEYESETTESKGLPSTYLNNALRTQLLLLDYKQFKAARIIQKTFRGWRVRNHMVKQSNAAKIIQRVWRRYLVGRNLQMIAEEKVQQSMEILFNSSSVKIQASFRGWWTRKHVNNTSYLHTLQLNAVQDILYEMIGSLHTMKRSNVLPGISTFYNQECMDKVQNLLSTLSYRMYNEVVARRQLRTNLRLKEDLEMWKKSQLYTLVPYMGISCEPSMHYIDMGPSTEDFKEIGLVKCILEANNKIHKTKRKSIEKVKGRFSEHSFPDNQSMFCREMMEKIKKWKALQDTGLGKSLQNRYSQEYMPDFLSDIKSYLESHNYMENCYCKPVPTRSCPWT